MFALSLTGTVWREWHGVAVLRPVDQHVRDDWSSRAYVQALNVSGIVHSTNTANGASVTCVISDNCPACTGAAALDLSKAAFSQLGALDTGVLQVQWSFPDATGQQQGQTQAQAQGAVGGDDAQKQGQQQQAAQPYGASQMASYGQAQAQGQAQDPAYVDGATGGSQMYGDTGTAVPTLYVRRRRL